MDDQRVWGSEEGLWTGDPEKYGAAVDEQCLMVLRAAPIIVTGGNAAKSVADTPHWTSVTLTERQVSRPQEGLIVIAYKAVAECEGERGYEAYCTTVYQRLEHDNWRVIQHQQTPQLTARN